jgi:hypothetical protein
MINFNTVTGLNAGYNAFTNDAPNYVVGGTGNNGFSIPSPIPSPWLSQDIGPVAIAGGDSYQKNTFTLVGSGGNSGGETDTLHYAYQPASGNCLVSARVAAEEAVNPSTEAGVMIRNSLDPSDVEASVLVVPNTGLLFQMRTAYGAFTTGTVFPLSATPGWVQLARNGNTFTASSSADGLTWTPVGTPMTITMTTNVLLGLSVTEPNTNLITSAFTASAMFDNVTTVAPPPPYAAVHWEGDLLVNLQAADLSSNSTRWINRTSNTNAVGNFSSVNGAKLNVTNLTWNSQTVPALFINQNVGSAVQSVGMVPAEVAGNNPVSAEAWIYATAVNEQNSCAVAYGIQGGPSVPQADREFNYSVPGSGGGVSGDFGSYDTHWNTTPAPGAWHYLAWTYDGATVKLYLDGVLDAVNSPSSPLQTPATVVGVGAGLGGGPNLGADPFQGYIAVARVESGVLTANDIATNYALGLLAGAGAVAPSGLTATAGDGQAILAWDASPNATGYNVSRATVSNGVYTVIATNVAALDFTAIGLTNGVTYYFTVAATNTAGGSTNLTPVSVQPVSLASPQIILTSTSQQLQIAWPTNHVGWELQAQTNPPGQGLGTNWVIVPGSSLTNEMVLPYAATNGSVFFRLIYP